MSDYICAYEMYLLFYNPKKSAMCNNASGILQAKTGWSFSKFFFFLNNVRVGVVR